MSENDKSITESVFGETSEVTAKKETPEGAAETAVKKETAETTAKQEIPQTLTEITAAEENKTISRNFIEQIIDKDLAEGVCDSVNTRFPPEPNGEAVRRQI